MFMPPQNQFIPAHPNRDRANPLVGLSIAVAISSLLWAMILVPLWHYLAR